IEVHNEQIRLASNERASAVQRATLLCSFLAVLLFVGSIIPSVYRGPQMSSSEQKPPSPVAASNPAPPPSSPSPPPPDAGRVMLSPPLPEHGKPVNLSAPYPKIPPLPPLPAALPKSPPSKK